MLAHMPAASQYALRATCGSFLKSAVIRIRSSVLQCRAIIWSKGTISSSSRFPTVEPRKRNSLRPGAAAREVSPCSYVPTRASVERKGNWAANKSEEHTSELQSLMRISYAVFCLTKKKTTQAVVEKTQD